VGMNYYLVKEDRPAIHLGKSSAGWQFTFRGDREAGVVDYSSWLDRAETLIAQGYTMTDEGMSPGNVPGYMLADLLAKIEKKRGLLDQQPSNPDDTKEWNDQDGNYFIDAEFS